MKKFIKKVLLGSLVSCSIVSSTGVVYGIELVEDGELEKIVEVIDETTGYYGTVEEVYLDQGISKYNIMEFEDSYSLIIDTIENKCIIDDKVLSLEEYEDLYKEQYRLLLSRNSEKKSMLDLADKIESDKEIQKTYVLKHENYEREEAMHFHDSNTRCAFCPLNTINVPTTNYKDQNLQMPKQNKSFEIYYTTAVITAVANFLTYGAVEPIKILIKSLLAGMGVATLFAIAEYIPYISYHNVCPKAVREKRHIALIDEKTGTGKTDVSYHYYYSSKPW